MNLKTRIAALSATAALLLTPTAALAGGPEYAPEHPAHPTHPTPGPKASLPEKAKAYGAYCRGFSKKHVSGRKGTPFSNCVTAMAKAVTVPSTTAKAACKGFSKAHLKGQKGTEFSRCVVAAAKLRQEVTAS
jgi:hypothetical protein